MAAPKKAASKKATPKAAAKKTTTPKKKATKPKPEDVPAGTKDVPGKKATKEELVETPTSNAPVRELHNEDPHPTPADIPVEQTEGGQPDADGDAAGDPDVNPIDSGARATSPLTTPLYQPDKDGAARADGQLQERVDGQGELDDQTNPGPGHEADLANAPLGQNHVGAIDISPPETRVTPDAQAMPQAAVDPEEAERRRKHDAEVRDNSELLGAPAEDVIEEYHATVPVEGDYDTDVEFSGLDPHDVDDSDEDHDDRDAGEALDAVDSPDQPVELKAAAKFNDPTVRTRGRADRGVGLPGRLPYSS